MKDMGKGLAKRLSAMLLALALMLTMVPATVFAAETRTVSFIITDLATSEPIYDAEVTITAPAGATVNGYTAQVEATATDISYTLSKTGYKTVTKNVAIPVNGVINEEMEADTVTVSTSATGSGTVTVNEAASATVNRGSQVDVVIAPAEGWYVSAVTGLTGYTDTGYTGAVTANANTTIAVTFAQYLSVSAASVEGGTIALDKSSVKPGDTVTVTVTPDTGYWISSVGGHSDLGVTEESKTGYSKEITITENTEITASFVEFFTVTVTGGEHGTITAPTGGSVSVTKTEGAEVTVSAEPEMGYRVASVTVNNEEPTAFTENDKSYTAVFSANATVAVTFAPNTYTVTIPETVEHGTVTAGATTVEYNGSTTITLTPDDGYDVDSVTINGANAIWNWVSQKEAEITLADVTSNYDVQVTFKPVNQIATSTDITAAGNTYAYINIEDTLVEGKAVFAKNAAVTLTAATGYTGVRVNGGTDDALSASLTFTESITIKTVDLFDGAAWHRITLDEPLEIIIDKAAAEGELIAPALAEGLTHYNSDVTLVATFTDISGISSVSYRVATNSDIETQSGDVYTYHDGDEVKFSCDVAITVDAALNDCDDVKVYVDITDRAGNTVTKEIALKINTVAPQVAVKISGQKDSDAQAGYFNTQRAAIITITDRPSTFDSTRVSLVNKAENGATMPTITEWQEDEGVFTAQITFASEGSYDWEIQYTNKAGTADDAVEAVAVAELTSDEPITEPVWQFTCDTTDPTGAQIGYATTFWNRLLSTLSFHTWLNYEVTPVVQGAQDNLTTPTDLKVEYYKDGGTTALIVLGDEGLASKTFSTEAPKINAGEIATVYARVTDKAGNEVYLSTDGIIIDNVKPTITTTPDDDTKAENYNSDVEITVSVEDSGNYSGIRHVEYWMVKDGTAESHITLYNFNYDGTNLTVTDWDSNTHSQKQAQVTAKEYLSYNDLKGTWEGKILVSAQDYNSSNVEVHVVASDNAGGEADETVVHLDIDTTKPIVNVQYDAGNALNGTYFAATRTATVTITTRGNHFDRNSATTAITNSITALDANHAAVANAWHFVDESGAAITDADQYWTAGTANSGADTDTFTAHIAFTGDANYTFQPSYTNEANNTNDGVIYADSESSTNESFTVDKTKPTDCKITVEESSWGSLLQKLTFGLYRNTTVTAVATGGDILSGIFAVEYYKVSDPSEILSEEELETLYHSTENPFVQQEITVDSDELFVAYARITDKAGNYRYMSTEGFAVDTKASTISVTVDEGYDAANGDATQCLGTYYHNIETVGEDGKIAVTIVVEDGEENTAYSGIRKVDYYLVKDNGNPSDATALYENPFTPATGTDVDNENHPTRSDLKRTYEETIQVDAAAYNSDDVKLYIHTVDNAGNENTKYVQLVIDVTRPAINVSYDNNVPLNETYFGADRYATVTVTERTSGFNAATATGTVTDGITAKNLAGENVTGTWSFVSAPNSEGDVVTGDAIWTAAQGNGNVDSDTFTAYIRFGGDANYHFIPAYTDAAGNSNDGVSYADSQSLTNVAFTVDKTKPTDCWITVKENSWSRLLNKLTFGLYYKESVAYVATGEDALSGPVKVEYYKASNPTQMLDEDALNGLYLGAESPFGSEPIPVNSEELFLVYARITDKAGNYRYVSTEGMVFDTTPSTITMTPAAGYKTVSAQEGDDCLGTYYYGLANVNGDGKIDVSVTVTDGAENGAYSGIKSVDYYFVKDGGDATDQTQLYQNQFTPATGTDVDNDEHPTYDSLKRVFTDTIQVDPQKYNSDNVKLYVHTVDNTGNENTKCVNLVIDVTRPAISVSYDNSVPLNETYFGADRYATVTVTERTSGFNAATATDLVTNGITAKNASDEDVTGTWAFVSAPNSEGTVVTGDAIWTAAQGNGNVDSDTFTAYIRFGGDANYTFHPVYTDTANNDNTSVTYGVGSTATGEFTVDATVPTADITLHSAPWSSGSDNGDKTFANDFRSALTYGIWTNQTVEISGTAGDVTSRIHKVEWVKVTYGVDGEKANPYTLEGLQAANLDWNLIAEANWTGTLLRQSFTVTQVNPAETEADITNGTENDQQFIIYLKVTDKAGNVAYFSTADVTAEDSRPGHHNGEEFVAPKVAIDVEKPESGIFAGDVPVAVNVIDPRVGDTYSGLKLVTYEIHSYDVDDTAHLTQSGTLFDVSQVESDKPIQTWTTVNEGETDTRVVVNSSLNDSNKVVVTITAVDNAGNVSTNSESVMIDVTPPTVQVSFDNNEGDGTDSRYFKAGRTMTITVTERNFNEALFAYQITGTNTLTWQHSAATSGNGNASTHTATVSFSTDGDYQVTINPWKDIAGNTCEERDVTYTGTAPRDFVVDLTAPAVQVSYDNNNATNGNYYKADRVATITVTEHNFDASRVTITGTATDDGVSVAFPTLSSWSDGGDNHTATLHYSGDALYNFDVAVSDQAGNGASDYAGDTFYVDKTMPELRIDGVADRSANSDVVAPVITYSDTNFTENGVSIALVGVNGGEADYDGHYSSITHGQTFTYSDFAREKAVDDLYTLTAHVTDLAGNESVQSIFFSVNRFGSVYDLSSVRSILNKYLQNEQDIVFTETNVDSLDRESIRIVLTKNGIPTDLSEGQDYAVTETGGDGQWSQYRYTIHKNLFAEDGRYSLAVYSVDAAGNINENIDEAKEAEISFGVDKTLPVIIPIDLESNTQYPIEDKTVDLEIKDNLVLQNVTIYIDGEEAEYTVNGETYTFTIHESNRPREILIVAVDAAGNEYEMSVTNVLVSTNIFARYFNNKPLFYGSIGGVAVVAAAVLILTKTHGAAAAAAGAGKKVAAGAGKKKKAGK